MNIVTKGCSFLFPAIVTALVMVGSACAADSEATRLLTSRNAEFTKEIIKVSDNVYTAVGYAVSPVSMIIGPEGIVIVDTGLDIASGKEIRADFRRIVDKPVKAIVFTHGHPDHTHGAFAFMDTPDVQVWARQGLSLIHI